MATINKEALQWLQDEFEFIIAEKESVEEELELALEENTALKAQLARMKATLQYDPDP